MALSEKEKQWFDSQKSIARKKEEAWASSRKEHWDKVHKNVTRVNKLDVQDERAARSRDRVGTAYQRMADLSGKLYGTSKLASGERTGDISAEMSALGHELDLVRQYERKKRKKESDVFEAPFKITPSASDSEKISYGMGGTPFSSPSEIRKQAQARRDYAKDMNRPSAGEYLGAIGTGGLSSFNQALFSTLDFFTPTELLFGEENDPVSKLNRYYSSEKDKYMTRTQDTFERSGEVGKFIGELGVSTVQTLPNTILALMSGGGSIAAQGSSALGRAAPGLVGTISTAFNNMVRTPTFWTSALQMVGPAYDEAKSEGAGEIEAMTTALISGIINSGVEVGGGLETLPAQIHSGNTNIIREWVSSMLDEGKEEVVQGIVDNLTRKSIYDQNREWFSTDDENAVFNPVRSAEEFAGGALVGGLLGGSQILASNAINRAGAAIQEQAQRKTDAIPPSATREDILYQLAQDMANERLGGVNEDKVSVAPRSSNPYTVYTQGPQPAQKVNPARDPAMVDYIAETLGKNGSVSMRRLYDGEMDTDAYSAEFLESYSAGMRGDEKPAPQSLTPAQSEAAYVAGQADRKGKTAAPIGRQTGGDTYGRTEEALVGRHEARGYDDTGTYRPVLRKRDTTGTGLRGDETKGSGSTAVYAGGNEKRAEVNQAVSGPVIRGGETYGRTEEALVGRNEARGNDNIGAYRTILRERYPAQADYGRGSEENDAITNGRPGPAGAGEAGRGVTQAASGPVIRGGETYGRTEEALVGRHEVGGYDPGRTGSTVLRERDPAGADHRRGSEENERVAAGRPGPAGAGEAGRGVTQAASGPVIRGGETYGRTEEALVGRNEAGGYDPGGAGGPVLRERGAAQTGDSRANRGNEAIPADRPGPAGAGEAGKEVIQTARSWQEDPAAFTTRSTERGGVVRQMGSVSVAYRETEPARWSSHTRETVEAFREFGIEPHVVDFLERNSNGYTSRSEEAVTSPEGEVYLVEGSGINGRQVAAHEALHKGLREGTPEALAFRESVLEADFSDQMAQEAFITIQTEYFDKRGRVFDPSKDMDKLYEEFAAYMSGFLGDGSAREQLGAAYADFDGLERQWQAMKEAMKHGSGQLYSEEHGQAMQQVQAPAGENGELQTIPGLDTGRGADRGRVPGVREEGNEGVKRSLESPEAAARQVRRLQKRGADAKMEATRHSLKEDMVYGGAREESRESFYARGREGTGGGFTVVERGPYACAYRGVARVQESAARVRQSLQAWGIDSAVVDGPVYVNKGGVTTARPVREAATIQGMVFISNGTTIPPLDTAGHEAYHAWKGTSARTDYTDTVRENLNYGGREFLTYQQKIADAYFGGDVELSDVVQLRKFEEELFAYISGHLNCGDYESTLRAMFRDYDAVKAAWEKLVIYMREVTEYGTGQLYSEEQHGRVQQVQEVQEGNLQMREVPGVDSAPEAGGNVPGLRAEGDHRPRKDWQGTREEVKRGTADFQYDQRAPGHEIDRFAVLGKEGGERWSAQRLSSGTDGKRPMPLSDLIGKIRHDFGISITTGHIRGSKTRGRYNRADQGIRTKIANDLPTVSHELGHHLDNLYGLTQNLKPGPQAELIDNLDQGMKDAYPKKKWVTEGLAEYVRRFLQNRETAAIDYPQFTEHFLSSMKNTDGPIIEQFADEINAYYALDTSTATSSVRLAEERGMDFRTIKEKAKEMGDDIYQAWVDSNHAIKRFDERAGSNVYLFATNSAYSDSMAGQILTGDLTDRNGQYVAPGLKTALSGVNLKNKSEYRAFGEYLIVRHGPERLKEGLRVFADDRKNSTNWMEGRQAELEEQYPAFKEAADRLYQFESDFLRTWGVETGLVSGKSADEWEERWKYYVPFNRAMDKQRAGAKKGYANQSSGIKKAIGSGLDIVHPVDNIVFNVTRMVNAGVRNNVMKELTSAAQRSGGMADFLEKVPMPLQRKSYDATKLKGGLKQSIEESSMSQEDKDAAFDIVENIDDILYQYGRGKAGGDVVTVMKGGKLEYWKINDKSLLSSITAMSPAKLPAVLEAYGAVSRFMTGNITGNNLLWSIFSNSPRDMMTLFTYSKDKNPLKLFGGVMSTYANQMKGQNADPLFKEYLAMGGGKSSAYTADRSLAKRTRKKLTNKSALEWLNPMEALSAVSDSIEMGPRFAYYKILRQKGVSPQQAFYKSADITTNFRRRGTNSQALNKFIPFFNASVQGLDKFSRWIRATEVPSDKRAKVVRVRTTAYILSSALLAALIYGINNRDDESEKEYEQLSNYTKNAYWAIPIGDGKFFTIPKPREIAVLSSFFETLAEYFYGDNRHAFDGFYDYASENFLPTGASDVAKMDLYGFIGSLGLIGVGANMMANRDFMGRPIVSAGLQSLEPKDQYTNRTSAIAKAVGGAFNQSPQIIDYFFGQTLGGWWKMQKALFPVDGSQRDLTLGIQGTYVKDNQYSIDLLNWLYDKADASAAASKSDPGNTEKAIESKWDSNMTTFYSRYNKLSKDKSETTATRATRQTVLDMILEYQKAYDSGTKTAGQKAVEAVCKSAGTTEYLPSVVQSTIKDEKEQSHTLSAAQYVEYQGEYLRLYWEAVEDALPRAGSQKEKEEILKNAKDLAADTAKARALKRVGGAYEKTNLDYGGVDIGDVAVFEAAFDMLTGDKDDEGKTIPGSKQEEVIEALENMSWLTDKERDYLFSTKYTSDKNNPWAGMAPDEEEEISIEAKDEAVNRLLSGIYW